VDRDEIVRVLRAFEVAGLEYVLIGATAMGLHGLVRATEDVDLFIRATAENIERLRTALRDAYDGDPHIDEISTADLLGDFDTVEAETRDIAGTLVRVATPQALYRLKRDTVRAKDREDAAALKQRFALEDES
jgi:hypothetical protein